MHTTSKSRLALLTLALTGCASASLDAADQVDGHAIGTTDSGMGSDDSTVEGRQPIVEERDASPQSEGSSSGTDDAGVEARPGITDDAGADVPDPVPSTDCGSAAMPQQGLLLWLRADRGVTKNGSQVSAWDNAGSAGDFSASTPARLLENNLNGHPVISFDGKAAMHGSVPVKGKQELTIALVSATTKYQAPGQEWCNNSIPNTLQITENGCSGTYNLPLMWPEIGSWVFVFLGPMQQQVAYRCGPGSTTYSNYDVVDVDYDENTAWRRRKSIGDAFTYTAAIKTHDKIRLYVESDEVMNRHIPGGAGPIKNASDTAELGSGRRNDLRWTGSIAEAIVFDHAITDAERTAMDAYINCRYEMF